MTVSRRTTTRWTYYDPALLYLFPATYIAHLLEEWFAGAPIVLWAARAERPLGGAFIAANAFALVLMLVGIRLVNQGSRFHWIVPALATAVLLNTCGHLAGSFTTGGYSAGLMTAMILWVPLGLLTLFRVWDQAPVIMFRAGLLVGVAIEAIVAATLRLI